MVLAELLGAVAEAAKFTPKVLGDVAAADFEGLIAAHPLRGQGYEFDVPVLPGGFVTADTGTGFVHIAPGHGEDDFELGVANGVEVPDTVAGRQLLSARAAVRRPHLHAGRQGRRRQWRGDQGARQRASLLAKGRCAIPIRTRWRSKAPVIFRATPQWFVAIDKPIAEIGGTLREQALTAIDDTKWYPPRGQNRIGSMVERGPTGACRASAPGACRWRSSSTRRPARC